MAIARWVVICLSLSVSSLAQSSGGTISGSVSGIVGTRLPGVTVTLKHHESGHITLVTTGERGIFRASGLPSGRYEVVAELSGFAPGSVSVELPRGGSREIDLVLSLAFSVSETVNVIGTAPHESLEVSDIRESPARDVGEAMTQTPGVWKVRKGGIANDIVLRGFKSRNFNVLIDGQRIYGACPNSMDPASFHVDFSEVERIDIGKGPFDMKNQGSLGGTVNIVTRKPEEGWHLSANLAGGSYGFVNPAVTASYAGPAFSALGGFSYRVSDAYRDGSGKRFTELANYLPSAVDTRAFDIGTAWGKIGWAPAPQHQFQLSYTRQDVSHVLYPYLLMDADFDDADRVGLRYDAQALSDRLTSLTAHAYYTQVAHWMTDQYRTSSVAGSRGYSMGTMAGTRTIGFKVDAELGRLVMGAEVFERFWGTSTEMAGMNYKKQYSLPDVTIGTFGLFAEYESTLTDRLSLSLGARLDRARTAADEELANTNLYYAYKGTRLTSTTDTLPSGKMRLMVTVAPGVKVSAGVGHVSQVPEPTERYFALKRKGADWVGYPELSPSRNTGVDVSFTFERPGYSIGVNGYVNRVSDFVALHDQFRVNGIPGVMNQLARSYTNVDAILRGAEVDGVVSLTDRLFFSGDLSYVRGTKEAVPELNIFSENLAEIPPLRARLRLRFDNGLWFSTVEGLFGGTQENVDTDLREEETPGYGVVNLSLGARRGKLAFTLGIGNLFDKLYLEYLSYHRDPFRSGARVPEPGRNIFANVAFRF